MYMSTWHIFQTSQLDIFRGTFICTHPQLNVVSSGKGKNLVKPWKTRNLATHRSPDAVDNTIGVNHNNINSYYVDGISLTHGSPRQHIWTFMAGLQENTPYIDGYYLCSCPTGSTQLPKVQSFLGNDYFCESGCPWQWKANTPYFFDPLWDGIQCGSLEQECWYSSNHYIDCFSGLKCFLASDSHARGSPVFCVSIFTLVIALVSS